MKNKNDAGFSLVELSIVLVIIGLIVAAIAGGSHMLHTAKLNTVISELRGYSTGVENFRNKYNYWPGDLPNATKYWGAYDDSDANNILGVKDGDGDESIDTPVERLQTWSHMSKAGFITGKYTGEGTANGHGVGGVNIPESSGIEELTFFMNISSSYGIGGTYIAIKKASGFNGIIKSEDAYYIEKKIDDGDNGVSSAGTGNLFAIRGDSTTGAGNCVDQTRATTAPLPNYILTDFDPTCRLVYWIEKD